MGEVYGDRHTAEPTVAIKVLPPHFTHNPERSMLRREAQTIAGLNHPNICTPFDVGRRETDFLVMEYLRATLAARTLAARSPR
jgi:serine/threonine protein kinase